METRYILGQVLLQQGVIPVTCEMPDNFCQYNALHSGDKALKIVNKSWDDRTLGDPKFCINFCDIIQAKFFKDLHAERSNEFLS